MTVEGVPLRPTRAVIDLDRIESNFRAIRRLVGGARVFPVVKANAYGHGAAAVARRLEEAGADALCVALIEEGLELRAAGVTGPVLVIGSLDTAQIGPALDAELTPTVHRPDQLDAVEAAGLRSGRPARFHLKVDTGMSRLGLPPEELNALLDKLAASPHAALAGVFSALGSADRPDDPFTLRQLATFEELLGVFSARGIDPGVRHLANSSALGMIPASRYDAVRPGLIIYGIPPVEDAPPAPLLPALSLVSRIVQVREVPAGAAVGYSATWRAPSPRRLATIPAGYDDGVMRSLSNNGQVLVRGVRAPVVGRVSMDLTVADVTDCGGAATGDEVVIIGEQLGESIGAWEIAQLAGTIPWEVLCRIGGRVPRDFYEGGRLTARWTRWGGTRKFPAEAALRGGD